jgi:hypothetical protein
MLGKFRGYCALAAGVIKLPLPENNESVTSPSLLRQMTASLPDLSRLPLPTGYFKDVPGLTFAGRLGGLVYCLASKKPFKDTGTAVFRVESYRPGSLEQLLSRIGPQDVTLLKETKSHDYNIVLGRATWEDSVNKECRAEEESNIISWCHGASDAQLIEYAAKVNATAKNAWYAESLSWSVNEKEVSDSSAVAGSEQVTPAFLSDCCQQRVSKRSPSDARFPVIDQQTRE